MSAPKPDLGECIVWMNNLSQWVMLPLRPASVTEDEATLPSDFNTWSLKDDAFSLWSQTIASYRFSRFKLWPSVNLYGIPERAKPVFFFPNDDKTLLNIRKGRTDRMLAALKRGKEKKSRQLVTSERSTCTASPPFQWQWKHRHCHRQLGLREAMLRLSRVAQW